MTNLLVGIQVPHLSRVMRDSKEFKPKLKTQTQQKTINKN